MSGQDFLGALAVGDTSGFEVVRRVCPKHGRYEFHPAICESRAVECPACQRGRAKVTKGGKCAAHGPFKGKACPTCSGAETRARQRKVFA